MIQSKVTIQNNLMDHKMPGKLRPFTLTFTVSAVEREELLSAAERNAMSAAAYVRARALLMARREAKLEQQFEQRLEATAGA